MAAHERRQLLQMLALVLATAMLPGLALTAIGLADASTVAVFGAITGVVASLAAGERVALITVGSLSVLAAVAVAFPGNPWLAAVLVAGFSAAMAMTAQQGRSMGLMLAPISLTLMACDPPMTDLATGVRALIVLGVIIGCGVLGIAVRHRLIPLTLPEAPHASRSRAIVYATTVTVLSGVATWVVVDQGLGHVGAWAVMTILLVVQPYLQDSWTLSVQRALGTMLGFIVAIALGVVGGWPVVAYVVGGVLMFLALVARVEQRAYWQYAALLTPAVVLLEGTTGTFFDTAWQRLIATVVGAGIGVLTIALLRPLYIWASTREDAVDATGAGDD